MARLITDGRHRYQLMLLVMSFLLGSASWAGVTTISQQALLDKQAANAPLLILDVRTPQEYEAGRVPGAINIPHTLIGRQLSIVKQAIEAGKEIVVYCRSGRRAGAAEEILLQAGISDLRHLDGDMISWERNRRPIENGGEHLQTGTQ